VARRRAPDSQRHQVEAAQWFAASYLLPAGVSDWAEVRARHVQEWTIWLLGQYSDTYASNQFRALQQFFKWHATEDPDEPRPNPMATLKPPKVGDKLVPVFTDDELAAMLATCKGGGFQNRRDYAVISLFKDAGIRLSELAALAVADVRPAGREADVAGKGDKQRTVRFTYDTSRALDRYLRERARHRLARVPALWLGVRSGGMTASGIYQLIERRGLEAGVEVNPHKFRHHFSHTFRQWRGRRRPDGAQRLVQPPDARPLRPQRPKRPSTPPLRRHHGRLTDPWPRTSTPASQPKSHGPAPTTAPPAPAPPETRSSTDSRRR
jgi:site-specific recombinase XerD